MLPSGDLHKLIAGKGERLRGLAPVEELLEEGESLFFGGVSPGMPPMAPVMAILIRLRERKEISF